VCETAGWEEVEPSLGLATLAQQAWRRAEARAVAIACGPNSTAGAARAISSCSSGRPPRSASTSRRSRSRGLPTYVVGGRGYWSQEQVRDGIAYLSVLANPLDETALYATLASPFCGVGADALVLLADAGRQDGSGAWAALQRPPATWPEAPERVEAARLRAFAAFAAGERGRAERLPVEVLLERAIAGTGYDLAILARPGGDRRLANIRKLMRLAREYERAEGRDLRGFLAYAASQDLAEAREGEAALESEALDAVRLMTIHRAKGLEFPVVCVADLGRPGQTGRPRLLLGRDGAAGLKLVTTAGGDPVPALGYDAIAATRAVEEAAEERRLLYVAATRAEECLILSGGTDLGRWPEARPGGPPLDWLAPALLGDAAAVLDGLASEAEDDAAAALGEPPSTLVPCGDGRVLVRLVTPATLPPAALAPAPRTRPPAPGTVLPAEPRVVPAGGRPRPAQRRLSYSALQDYGRCGYRFYLERVLRLPRVAPPPPLTAPEDEAAEAGIDPRVRGTLVHQLLERLDFARPVAPGAEEVLAAGAALGLALSAEEVADIAGLVGAFAGSPLCARLAAARHVRREAAFAFALEADGGGPLLSGFVDALAREPDGSVLVVDYKSDRLGEDEPATLADRDYGTQRQVYALAALRDGAPAVEVAHCFLERPAAPAVARYTRDDAPALAVALLDLAGGVLAERWPVTPRPHRELCGDCPGRSALCSWPESVTLRPYEDAGGGGSLPARPYLDSAGTLAGSGGPS
jgi:ATP-dependent exoDNAse (exonuclease V) beta subunit